MRGRSLVAVVAILFGFGIADAGSPKHDIQTKIKEAMENYDLMDYDAARKSLTQALSIAKKSKLDKDPVVAKAHLSLGIVQFANSDTDGAKLSFLSAVQIDPKIQIDAAYKSNEMSKLLESVRKEASGGGGSATPEPAPAVASGVDCSSVQGMQHSIIDTAKAGAPLPIEALVGADVAGTTKVVVLYRVEGATDFTEVKLKKEGDCKYTGAIPSAAMKGSLVHYYVAAYADGPKPAASKGSSGSPNIIEISGVAAAGGAGDNEDPIGGGGGGGGGGSVSSNVTVVGPKRARVMIAIAGGGGTGYVSGETEGMNTVKACCFGGPIVVLQPEIGYFVSPQLSIGAALRLGLPIGANVEGHATAAPGGVLRVRYALAASGDGLRVMGQVGAGILRNTIKLDNSQPGMDTDIVAQGPLLVGGGVGFTRRLSGTVSVMADLSALGAIAVVDSIGPAPVLNHGFGVDLNLGIQLGF
ncbi:MAG TPA: tetratricopeptide repeat protein [Kofleriaceae bacterium]